MTTDIEALQETAQNIRRNALASIYHAESGHPGGSLSCADLLAYICITELRWADGGAMAPDRDRFVLSKGHACPALYAAAAEMGVIPKDMLVTLRKTGSPLQGHPHTASTPWVETSTGSLGQGFSAAIGMALGLRHQGSCARVYALLGDGELQEGETWEGAMCAGHYELANLCAIVDYNKMQSDDFNENVMRLEPLRDKWEAFNWTVLEIDGHDFGQIREAFDTARTCEDGPTVIIAHTLKGKGVSFMEGVPSWHGSVKLSDEDLVRALHDLGVDRTQIEGYLDGSVWSE